MKARFAMSMAILMLAMYGLVASPVQAAMVCDSARKSESTLPILESECPIGEGVWGTKSPNIKGQSFWIQCGFVKSGSLRSAPTQLQNVVSEAIWLKPDIGGDRCLVGPYQSFEVAKQELVEMRSLPSYSDAFIRSTSQALTMTAPQRIAQKSPPKEQAASTVGTVAVTPYMIAGKHGHQDCLCLF
ncbi:hypothetical protein [Vibrio sp. 10N]|uniref:hypothetical protein n=1 Tax=Vibrio sp. 10N TaxID=3058938 RepID=UPI0028132AF4|nr:hypothetical protein VB10N_45970 [Vibrio sp. 10N]